MKLKGKIKELTALTSAICMLSVPNTTALAATGTKINSVPLSIESEIEAGDTDSDVTVSTSSSKFDIDDVVITNEPSDEWDDGDKPKLKITLYADDDYYFASGFSKSSVSLSGSDGTVTSVSRSSSDTLIVYVTLDALDDDDSDHDLDVSGLEWDESDGTASWEESDDAKKYEVRLYRGSSAVTSVLTTTSTSYDFSSYITKNGYYTFKVRGVYNTSTKGSWEESDSWYVSSSEAQEISSSGSSNGNTPSNTTSSGTGAWLKDNTGWWYCNADRSYTTNGWQYIDNLWYCFDENGYMKTGWILYKDAWYYCGESGAMLVNTTTPDGYYVNGDGVCLLIPPGSPHFPEFLSFDQPYRRFVLWLNRSYYEKLHKQDADLTYCFDTAASNQIYRIPTDRITAQDIQGKLMDLLEENSSERIFHAQASELMAVSFLVYVNRLLYSSLHEHSQVFENALYLKICDYIHQNLEDDLSLERIAANFYVSKYHIAHIFKDNMGISLHQYILKKRLHASRQAILSGEPISRIFPQYGFKDYTSFFRAFKKEYGISPKEYREQHRLIRTEP